MTVLNMATFVTGDLRKHLIKHTYKQANYKCDECEFVLQNEVTAEVHNGKYHSEKFEFNFSFLSETLPAFDLRCRLGGGREREPHAGLSKVTSTSAVEAVAVALLPHTCNLVDTFFYIWWGRGMEVTGLVWRR
jgi:hypothetical protein